MIRYLFMFLLATTVTCQPQHPSDKFKYLLGFALQEDSLATIRQKLGPAKLVETGDAGDYLASISYYFEDIQTTISFQSGEMGAGGLYVIQFVLRRSHSCDSVSFCHPNFIISSASQANVGGLYVGMTPDKFTKIVGRNVHWTGDLAEVDFTYRYPWNPSPDTTHDPFQNKTESPGSYDVTTHITGIFIEGILYQLIVSRIESD